MSRIRSIKPEFPQSETIGALSRDARLLFIQLWTIVDDAGRARAASRMLASLLYPYDDDARDLIDSWLDELERHDCIRRYEVDGTHYLVIPNWLKHQKIDRPSKSKFPEPPETLASPREDSRVLDADLGPGSGPRKIMVHGGRDAGARDPEPNPSEGQKPLVPDEAMRLAEEIAVIAGYPVPTDWPPGWCGAPMRVASWLAQGWRADVALAAVRASMARKRDGPPSTITYFERAIARAHAVNEAPVPTCEIAEAPKEIVHGRASTERPGTDSSVHAASRRLADAARGRLAAFNDAFGGDGDGAGGDSVRLLPQG